MQSHQEGPIASERVAKHLVNVHGRILGTHKYLIVSLARFEPPRVAQGESSAVAMLNDEGRRGWEAVGLTTLDDGTCAVLLKRPLAGT